MTDAETIAEAPVQLSANGKAQDTLVRGLPADGELLGTYTPAASRCTPAKG